MHTVELFLKDAKAYLLNASQPLFMLLAEECGCQDEGPVVTGHTGLGSEDFQIFPFLPFKLF